MVKILIIEDDSLILRMYQKIFEADHYGVITALDGEEGFRKAKAELPKLILLDVMMPKLNGLQVLEKLKNESSTKNIPVIMLTNLADEQNAEKALRLGAVKYIVKSKYKPGQVEELVKGVLAGYTREEIPETKV